MFIINFAKENLFKHGISFDVVGATIGRLFIFIKYTFLCLLSCQQMYSYIDNKYYLCYILTNESKKVSAHRLRQIFMLMSLLEKGLNFATVVAVRQVK